MEAVEVPSVKRFYLISLEQWNVVCIIFIVSIASIIPVGYHIVVLNVPEKVIQKAIEDELLRNYKIDLSDGSLSLLWWVD